MGFRFYKSVSIGKGVRVGMSKTGVGLGVGAKGFRYSVHSSGRTRKTVGVPGTGVSYSTYGRVGGGGGAGAAGRGRASTPQSQVASAEQLATLLKAPLFAPKWEKAYARGLRDLLISQNPASGIQAFQECASLNPAILSAYFLGGYAAVKLGREKDAIAWFEPVVQADDALPDALMVKYGLDGSVLAVSIPMGITPMVTVEVDMSSVGAVLILAELYQEQGEHEKAIGALENLVDAAPENPALALSLSELYHQQELWDELASLPVRVENKDDLSADVLRYKARAMREKGMLDGALELLKEALKSNKRDGEILKASRYERGLTYLAMGKKAQARKDLERLYAEDPTYEDVGQLVTQL